LRKGASICASWSDDRVFGWLSGTIAASTHVRPGTWSESCSSHADVWAPRRCRNPKRAARGDRSVTTTRRGVIGLIPQRRARRVDAGLSRRLVSSVSRRVDYTPAIGVSLKYCGRRRRCRSVRGCPRSERRRVGSPRCPLPRGIAACDGGDAEGSVGEIDQHEVVARFDAVA